MMKKKGKTYLRLLLAMSLLMVACRVGAPALAATNKLYVDSGYAGLDYFGSGLMTRSEVESILRLKPRTTLKNVVLAVDRLKSQMEARNIEGNVQMSTGDEGEIYVSVDIISPDTEIPSRRLINPQRVDFRSEEPAQLLEKLHGRIKLLEDQGRPVSEELKDGIKFYTDEPCNQIIHEIMRSVPQMRTELIAVVDHDPNAVRRTTAVELLNWAGDVPDTAYSLLPALDDADVNVRAMVVRYLFPRFALLPDNFPMKEMTQSFGRLLRRPAHTDRSKALYALLALGRKHPVLIPQIKDENEAVVKELSTRSVIPSIRGACEQLIKMFAAEEIRRKNEKPFLPFLPP